MISGAAGDTVASLFCLIGNCVAFPIRQKSAPHGSHCGGTEFVAPRDAHSREEEICPSDRARRENVPRHILFQDAKHCVLFLSRV